MTVNPTAYLVLVTAQRHRCWWNRCGQPASPLNRRVLPVSAETSMPPQPRGWFADVTDEVDPATARSAGGGGGPNGARRPSGGTTSTVGRTPMQMWGDKLMWNQAPLLLQRAEDLPNRRATACSAAIRDVVGSDPVLVRIYRPDGVPGGVVLARSSDRVWRGRPDWSAMRVRVSRRCHRTCREDAARPEGWRTWFSRTSTTVDVLSGVVAQPDRSGRDVLGARPGPPAIAGVERPGRSAFRRMGGALPRRCRRKGCRYEHHIPMTRPTSMSCGCWSRSRPHHPRGRRTANQCCCSPPVRIPSSLVGWKAFRPAIACSRCCMSTPGTTSTRSSRFRIAG